MHISISRLNNTRIFISRLLVLQLIAFVVFAASSAPTQASDPDFDGLTDNDPRPTVADLPIVVVKAKEATAGVTVQVSATDTQSASTSFNQNDVQHFSRLRQSEDTATFSKSETWKADLGFSVGTNMSINFGMGLSGTRSRSFDYKNFERAEDFMKNMTTTTRSFSELSKNTQSYDGSSGFYSISAEFLNIGHYPVTITEFNISLSLLDPESGEINEVVNNLPVGFVEMPTGKLLPTTSNPSGNVRPLRIELPPNGPAVEPFEVNFEFGGLNTAIIQRIVEALASGRMLTIDVNRFKMEWTPPGSGAATTLSSEMLGNTLSTLVRQAIPIRYTGLDGVNRLDFVSYSQDKTIDHYLTELGFDFSHFGTDSNGASFTFGPGYLVSMHNRESQTNYLEIAADTNRSGMWVVQERNMDDPTDIWKPHTNGVVERQTGLSVLFDTNRRVRESIFKHTPIELVVASTEQELPNHIRRTFADFENETLQNANSLNGIWSSFVSDSSPRIDTALNELNETTKVDLQQDSTLGGIVGVNPASVISTLPKMVLEPVPRRQFLGLALNQSACVEVDPTLDIKPTDLIEIAFIVGLTGYPSYELQKIDTQRLLSIWKLPETATNIAFAKNKIEEFEPQEVKAEFVDGFLRSSIVPENQLGVQFTFGNSAPTAMEVLASEGHLIPTPIYGENTQKLAEINDVAFFLRVSGQMVQSILADPKRKICIRFGEKSKFSELEGRWLSKFNNLPRAVWDLPSITSLQNYPFVRQDIPPWKGIDFRQVVIDAQEIFRNRPIVEWEQGAPLGRVVRRGGLSLAMYVGLRRNLVGRTPDMLE